MTVRNKYFVFVILLAAIYIIGCKGNATSVVEVEAIADEMPADTAMTVGNTLADRIAPPDGYSRVELVEDSFQEYLRNIPLRPIGSEVKYYNGRVKSANNVYCAVVDLEIGSKDLHQCADAVMRLRAEYLWHKGEYEKIHFNFTNGFTVEYTEFMKGRRMIVQGNSTEWDNGSNASNTYKDFWKYMELIFTYAGTASLERELVSADMSSMKVGDVLIKGGHPGHAVIVMDMVID